MDQAIASAPLIDGKARLDAGQIRELMGAVPNATFERILAAVNDNNSADVITIANDLLDAGNSPAQLSRQAVRYLRSCVIAKIAGLTPEGDNHTELLQISPEEQRRAARTAALFTEEELTRFLQTMLRTFDEMGYRQEQRFHFELGLLKLVHLRRLLPVEELLSSLGPAAGTQRSGTTPARPAPGPVSVPRPSSAPASHPPASAKPAFSPFEQDPSRRKYDNVPTGLQSAASSGANALASTPAPVSAPQPILQPAPVAPPKPLSVATPVPVAAPIPVPAPIPVAAPLPTPEPEPVPEPAAAIVPSVAAPGEDNSALQKAIIEALQAAGQESAAEAVEDSTITLVNGEARIQTQLSKTLLPITINPEAERLLKAALRTHGVLKHTLLSGAATSAAAKKPRAAKSGSAQAKAEQHPLIQQARRLFDAEIQAVIDLSEDA
jgi:DNA polymerase-3 subunit gamma/tau